MQVMSGTQMATFTRALRDTVKRRHQFTGIFPKNITLLCIQDLKPALHVQSDSLRAKVLAWHSFMQIRFNLAFSQTAFYH